MMPPPRQCISRSPRKSGVGIFPNSHWRLDDTSNPLPARDPRREVHSTRYDPSMTSLDPAANVAIAPSGTLRAAINFDNPILASKDARGLPGGVSVELARELAQRLGFAIEYVPYYAAGKVVEGLQSSVWDICFLAIDPGRDR